MAFALLTAGGNLGSDPESRYTPNGAFLLEFSLAVNTGGRNSQDPPTWYRCTAWDALAERMNKLAEQGYIAKGSSLVAIGNFRPRPYQDREGKDRVSFDMTLVDFQFMGGGNVQPQANAPASPPMRDVPF